MTPDDQFLHSIQPSPDDPDTPRPVYRQVFEEGDQRVTAGRFRKPRRRFRWLALVVTVLAVGFVGLLASQEVRWIGRHTSPLTVRVVDATTGRPIPGASVRVFDDEGSRRASAGRTGADGRVLMSHAFTAIGTNRLFRKTGVLYLWLETVKVEAKGNEPLRVSLEEHAGSVWDLYGPPLPTVEVRLQKKQPPG